MAANESSFYPPTAELIVIAECFNQDSRPMLTYSGPPGCAQVDGRTYKPTLQLLRFCISLTAVLHFLAISFSRVFAFVICALLEVFV